MTANQAILRNLFHLSGVVFPLVYALDSRDVALVLATVSFCMVALLEFLRITGRFEMARVGKFLKERELKKPTGSFFYSIAALLSILLFAKWVAICSLLILCISDPLSSFIGRNMGRHPFFGKSIEGTAAFFCSALIIAAFLLHTLFTAIAAATVATLTELFTPAFLDDNLTIPVMTGLALTLLGA